MSLVKVGWKQIGIPSNTTRRIDIGLLLFYDKWRELYHINLELIKTRRVLNYTEVKQLHIYDLNESNAPSMELRLNILYGIASCTILCMSELLIMSTFQAHRSPRCQIHYEKTS